MDFGLQSGTHLVVSIVHCDRPLHEQVRDAIVAGATMVELRVDRIGDIDAVEHLLRQPHDVPYVLTIRSAAEGGAWDGDDADRIALFERLGLLLPGYIDVEYATWQRSANLRQKIGLVCALGDKQSKIQSRRAGTKSKIPRPKNALILSHHDLRTTPSDGDIGRIVGAMLNESAAVAKVVCTPVDSTDALRILMLKALSPQRERLVALGMGEAGVLTRVLARKLGLFAAYAALECGAEAAPGQPTVQELRSLYRWDSIRESTRVYGVVGWPVSHSLSPRLHNAAMAADEIDGVYLPLPVQSDYAAFERYMSHTELCHWADVRGLSVTVPHKENALRWLRETGGEIRPLAQRCGAVNTLLRRDDATWFGDNTDVHGVWHALDAATGAHGPPRRAAVLGAGGMARAAVVALQERGHDVTVFGRTPDRAAALASEMACGWQPWSQRTACDCELLVNCTSVGMAPNVDASPFPADALRPEMIVFDTVYTPANTRLLRDAAARGCTTISGVALFIGQAAAQYELWHGRTVPCLPLWASRLRT